MLVVMWAWTGSATPSARSTGRCTAGHGLVPALDGPLAVAVLDKRLLMRHHRRRRRGKSTFLSVRRDPSFEGPCMAKQTTFGEFILGARKPVNLVSSTSARNLPTRLTGAQGYGSYTNPPQILAGVIVTTVLNIGG